MSIRYQSLRILFFGRIGAGSIRTLDVYCSIIRDGALWGPAPARIYILADLVFLSILVSKVRLVTVSCLGGRCAIATPAILVSLVSLGSVAILVRAAVNRSAWRRVNPWCRMGMVITSKYLVFSSNESVGKNLKNNYIYIFSYYYSQKYDSEWTN